MDNTGFNPELWKPRVPNQAFLHARAEDKFWAARKLMALTTDLLRAAVRSGEFGDPAGEEFLICMPGAGLKLSMEVAEHMRKALEETEMECGGFHLRITASFGVFSLVPGADTTMNDMIEHADKMLYEAKHKGRNRVEGCSI
jgi:diguanylate cyclase (GGDEF)-like protein